MAYVIGYLLLAIVALVLVVYHDLLGLRDAREDGMMLTTGLLLAVLISALWPSLIVFLGIFFSGRAALWLADLGAARREKSKRGKK